ncbi:hypothetical protein [Bacillus massilinigeriensis]|uniref:hypothetical protein n=1 Tax=Bacillus mediterraneensis TaxID=1805474 RepID=UPI000AF8102E|nr:hypothetical protein [Bacillus mediterraneensis]
MPKDEFGIIDSIDPDYNYIDYDPEKYNCVSIECEYVENWWKQLHLLKTYYQRMSRPDFGLNRWGITIIPPESLPGFLDYTHRT